MKVKDKTKKSAKFKLFGNCATAGMIAFSALSFGILPNTIPHNVFAEQSSPFVVTEITNSNFNSTNTSTFPKQASNWEKLNTSSGIIAGVISSTETDFKNYYKQYGLFYSENSVLNDSDVHSNAYLMNALDKTAKFGLESSEFTLDANSYYAIRVDVKTGLECLINDAKTQIESFASIYLKLGDEIVSSRPYIITNNAWSTYYFFVQTSFEESSKAKVQLYLGSKEADSSGAVLFDNIICTKYSKALYDQTFANIQNKKKASVIGDSSKYEYVSKTSLTNSEYADRIEVTNTLFTDAELGNESLWTKEIYGNSSAIKSGFIDLSLGYDPAKTMVPKSPETNQIVSESKMLFMNILANSETEGASVTYSGKTFKLKRYGNYLIQFYVKTSELTGSGLHASLVPLNTDDYSTIKLTSIKSSSSPITNDWSLCQIYVQSSSYEDVEVKLEFGIGSVTEKSTATGYAFIDNLRAFKISYKQYANATAGSNIGKGEFSKSVSNTSKIENANFDKVSETAGVTGPLSPAEWTAVNENNKESGIINNQYIGFNAGNEYGSISWDTVGLTSAQNFIDINSRETFTDSNGNGKYDEAETFVDANGNGKFDGEIYVANQNLLMLNTLKNSYQAYTSKSVDLSASTLYKLSVDAKALVEGAYIKVTYGDNILDQIAITPSTTFKMQELVFITPKSTASIQVELGLGTKENPAIGYAFFDAIMLTELTDSSDSNYTAKGKLESLIEQNPDLNYVDLENNFFNEVPNSQNSKGLFSAQSWSDESESGINSGIKIDGEQKSLIIASENSNTNHTVKSTFKYSLDSSKYYKVSLNLKTSAFENLENSGITFGFEEKNDNDKIFSNIIANEEQTFEFFLKAGELSEITPFISIITQNSNTQQYVELLDFKIEEITETEFTVQENKSKNNENDDLSNVIMIGESSKTENEESQDTTGTTKNLEPSAWSWILPTLITCFAILLAFIAIILRKIKKKTSKRGKKYKNIYDRNTTIHKAILDKEVEELRAKKLEEAKASLIATQEKLRILEDSYKEKTKNDDVNKEAEYKKLVRNRKRHATKEQKLKEEIEFIESEEFKEVALNEVLANREKALQDFVDDNQIEKFEETEIVVDENLNKIEANNNGVSTNDEETNIHEIIVNENAETELNQSQNEKTNSEDSQKTKNSKNKNNKK